MWLECGGEGEAAQCGVGCIVEGLGEGGDASCG